MDTFDEEMFDMMEKERNIAKHYDEQFSFLLSLEPKAVQSLVDVVNNYGSNLSISKLASVTGLSTTSGSAVLFRNSLVGLIHSYSEHRELLNRDFEDSKFGKSGLDKIIQIIEKFNKKAIDGLNIRFSMETDDKEYSLVSLGSETVLHEIEGENRKIAGYVPLMHIEIKVYDRTERKTLTQKFHLELEECNAFIKGLENMRNNFVRSAKTYKEKLGDEVILTED